MRNRLLRDNVRCYVTPHRQEDQDTMSYSIRPLSGLFIALILFASARAQDHPRSVGEIAVPSGCSRAAVQAHSFGAWLRALPLKRDTQIRGFDGSTIRNGIYSVLAVVDMPLLFRRDLEQCADFCMRFWAEYHKAADMLDALYLFEYSGKKTRFRSSGLSYQAFLRRAFNGSNSHSLKKGCSGVDADDAAPGDMIVQNERGGIGHVSMILDACVSAKGERYYLIGFGFMPAQEFHIEKADAAHGRAGWFTLDGFIQWLRENLNVGEPVLRRFP